MPKVFRAGHQKGFAHFFLLILLLAGLGIGVYLVQHITNLKPKAGGAGQVAFLDNNGNIITQTASAKVRVRLNAPYPPASGFPSSTPIGDPCGPKGDGIVPCPSTTPIGDPCGPKGYGIAPCPSTTPVLSSSPESSPDCMHQDGAQGCPGFDNEDKGKKAKKSKGNEILVSGRLFQQIDLRLAPEEDGPIRKILYQVEYCDPDGDGNTNYAAVNKDGSFQFIVSKGQFFCVKPPNISGYIFPPQSVNAKSKDATSYENQIAGYDCSGKDTKKKDCRNVITRKLDLAQDNNFDFSYTRLKPIPTPTPETLYTISATLSEDPNFDDDNNLTVLYKTDPMIVDYAFQNRSPGKKLLYVQYKASNGQISKGVPYPAEIELNAISNPIYPSYTTPSSISNTNYPNYTTPSPGADPYASPGDPPPTYGTPPEPPPTPEN